MYENVGIHWGPGISAIIAFACLPFPFIFLKYGESLRSRCKYAAEAKQMWENLYGENSKDVDKTQDSEKVERVV